MKFLPLTNSPLLAIVDDEDYEKARQFKWWMLAGHALTTTWPQTYLHHLVFGQPSLGKETEHRNGNGLDCQKKNLREATRSQNRANSKVRSDSKSGFKGVQLKASGKYEARIRTGDRMKYLGQFDNPIEAAKMYDAAAKELYGEFARPNFPMRFPRYA